MGLPDGFTLQADSIRFRQVDSERTGGSDSAVFRAWIESVARLMRQEHLELECP